ncbi:hypothetical protein QCA50_003029 [Cerrena zonata]|uniref:Gaa1-domain-containing protein n=1 Tax=Cerrena zonata TaxID=2478898 RepID=A0AAW0GL86_9APHY
MALVLRAKFRRWLRGGDDGIAAKVRRKNQINDIIWKSLPSIRLSLLVAGYAWMLAIPLPNLGRNTYIDENALQPGQVNTYWNWPHVFRADRYLESLEQLRDQNSTNAEWAGYIKHEFRDLGIHVSTQSYHFTNASGEYNGTNVYAVLSSPRASGAEAMLISASRVSLNGNLNLRGIATVLSLAGYLKEYSLWSKDLVFVISDGYLEGMQAFITSYHGADEPNLDADPLTLSSGVIWTALNIDYPGHSFSHLGVFFEGLNGRLPNQDLINSFRLVSTYTGGVPVLLYDHRDPREVPHLESQLSIIPTWLPDVVKKQDAVREYGFRAKNILKHVGYQARGQTNGVHGLLHRFRIDAITLFAVPSSGPHGFHALGRVVESTLRTMNNLLEHLHASFFFYLLVKPGTFLKIGTYLPSVILVSVSMMFTGLGEWTDARWYEDLSKPKATDKSVAASGGIILLERPRPVLQALLIMLATHLAGVALFYIRTSGFAGLHPETTSLTLCALLALPPLFALIVRSSPSERSAPIASILKAANLCLASTVISVTSVLNFSLAAVLAVLLGVPLSYSSYKSALPAKIGRYAIYVGLGLGWLFCEKEVQRAIWNWEILGVWFAPFVCVVYTPLVLQAGIVSLLPS